ncbi:unnamed protein product [Heterosigma akashiwo]
MKFSKFSALTSLLLLAVCNCFVHNGALRSRRAKVEFCPKKQLSKTSLSAMDGGDMATPLNALVFAGYAVAFGAAGLLMKNVYGGSFGLGEYLSKDKPMKPDPNAPGRGENQLSSFWYNLKLPDLDFVEVYGAQQNQGPNEQVVLKAEQMKSEIEAAVQTGDMEYAKAMEKELEKFLAENGISISEEAPAKRADDFYL